jgi:quercetin dioxygenase-like cupin family protein
MKPDHPLDPDDPGIARDVEDALSEALAPLAPAPERAGALRARVLARAHASREAGRQTITLRLDDGEWRRLLPGVRVKRLGAAQRAVLLELAPGATLPVHRHHEDEECVVLRGEAMLGETVVRAGDYHLARANSRHGRVSSRGGALLYLRGTPIGHAAGTLRDLVTGWLPGEGEPPVTVRAAEGAWSDVAAGVRTKLLREDTGTRSFLVHLDAGGRVADADRAGDEECLVLEGEAFFGDALLRPGDYQRVPTGTRPAGVCSDTGALLFVRAVAAPVRA